MADGGPTRTSNTGTVGREAEANTIAKGIHHRLPTSMPGSRTICDATGSRSCDGRVLPPQCGISYHDSAH